MHLILPIHNHGFTLETSSVTLVIQFDFRNGNKHFAVLILNEQLINAD